MSSDGVDGSRNPGGRAMFDNDNVATATGGRPTRATAMGEVRVPTHGKKKTFVSHGLAVWNACTELREATTKTKALKAATILAQSAPI
jgi:hypothetical protein